MQGIGVHTTRKHLTRRRRHRIVSTCQAGDGVKEDDYIVSALYHALGLLQHDAGYLDVTLGRFVERRGNHLGIDGAGHVGHLLRTFVDEQHDHIYLGMVGSNGVGDVLHQDGLTGLGLCHDEGTLAFADGGEEVYHTG